MTNDNLDDFFLDRGDKLLITELCSHCGDVIYLDQGIEWIDKDKKIVKCPSWGNQVKING